MKVRLAISGCRGKMGRRVVDFAFQDPEITVVSGIEVPNHPDIGRDLGEIIKGVRKNALIYAEPEKAISLADVVVEFTNPKVTLSHLEITAKLNKKIVIGTTGFKKEELKKIKQISKHIAVLLSPNMSIGVNVLFKVLPLVTELLGKDYDIEIEELHHNRKKDAPSGTAKKIAEVIRDVRKELKFLYGREGIIGPRGKEELGLHSLRLGDIVGEHKIIFAGNNEKIELTHTAYSRDIFARGAILAIKFIKGRKAGLYTMENVLSQRTKG